MRFDAVLWRVLIVMISLSKVTWLELVWSGCCYRFTWSLKDSKSDTLNSTTSDVIQAKYFITLSQNCILRLKTARTYLYLHLNFLSRFIFNNWTIYCIFILCSRLTSQYSIYVVSYEILWFLHKTCWSSLHLYIVAIWPFCT